MTEAFGKQIDWWHESSKSDFGVTKLRRKTRVLSKIQRCANRKRVDRTHRKFTYMAANGIPKKITRVVQNYTDRIQRDTQTPIERVILYGSWAKGNPRKWSDIDVCVISPKFGHPLDAIAFLLQQRNREEVLAGIEPVGFTPQDFEEGSSLINEIKRTGVDLTSPNVKR